MPQNSRKKNLVEYRGGGKIASYKRKEVRKQDKWEVFLLHVPATNF